MKTIEKALHELSARKYQSKGILTLGELIANLKEFDLNLPVYFEDGKKPCDLDSWRGVYSELAISDNETHCKDGRELLEIAKGALTKTFYGYKGGEYQMDERTQLHRANYSECGNSFIYGVGQEDDKIVLYCREDG